MNELINEARIEWSSFHKQFNVFDWYNFVGFKSWSVVLFIKSTDENLGAILDYYHCRIDANQIAKFGCFVAYISDSPFIMTLLEDVFIIKKKYNVTIEDQDCLFLNLSADTVIRNSADVLEYGQWILLDYESYYSFEMAIVHDKYELEYLLSRLIKCNYFGFANFKRIVSLIEKTGKYEHLSLLIGAGLSSCPTAFRYILSYLIYLKNEKDYFNVDLVAMLYRFGFYQHFIDRDLLKIEFETAFPGSSIYEIMETIYYYQSETYKPFW
jgi:hypothetical protein